MEESRVSGLGDGGRKDAALSGDEPPALLIGRCRNSAARDPPGSGALGPVGKEPLRPNPAVIAR